jgi:large subunit ribosomal protein L21
MKAEQETKAVEATPEAAAKAPLGELDDLTKIEGVGPKYQDALRAAGIDTYAKLAAASIDAIRNAAKAAGLRNTRSMETWAEQAKLAAAGDWDGLARFQDSLSGGRKT